MYVSYPDRIIQLWTLDVDENALPWRDVITHSTMSPEFFLVKLKSPFSYIIHNIQEIKLGDILHLIGEHDPNVRVQDISSLCENDMGFRNIAIRAYNLCLEDNKDKIFTIDDVTTIMADIVRRITEGTLRSWEKRHFVDLLKKSISPLNEWQVVIENNKLKLIK